VELNEELQRAVSEQGDRPVEVVDPGTNRVYLLIAREQYDRLRPLFEDDPLSVEEQRHLRREAGRRAGWDDPEMDAYDRYDEARSQQP
ncbi:MAG TPA: hypothetical protein VML55_10150, partial [Planctomycetaceae bacterium]|nr:hypothetical protein [Planctomycetaceae bacterium]